MPAGLQVMNNSNIVQIDSTYANYVLWSKGTATASTVPGWAVSGMYTVSISSNRKNSIIAIRCASNFVVLNSLDAAGNVVHQVLVEGAVSFDYFIFTADPPGAATFGMEVYNESGVRVYQATEKYLKMLGFYTTAVAAGTSGTISTPNKTPAYICASYCALFEGSTVPNPNGAPISHGVLRSLMGATYAGGASYKSRTISEFDANRGTSNNAYASFILVDVDNL